MAADPGFFMATSARLWPGNRQKEVDPPHMYNIGMNGDF